MSIVFQQSEATAAQRRFPVYLVDAADGITPETGESGGQPQISKNGAAFGNTSATLTAVGNGFYYVELTATELDTLGMVTIRYKSANTVEFNLTAQVVAYDPYAAYALASVATETRLAELDAGNLPTDIANVQADTDNIQTRLPAALVGGRMDSDVGNMQAGVVSAAAIASNAVDADALATDAVTEIAGGVWDEAKAGHVGVGSFGEEVQSHALETVATEARLAELDAANLPADIDAILLDTGTTLDGKLNTAQADLDIITGAAGAIIDDSAANDATISDAVWDEAKAGHVGAGSFGEEVQSHALSSEISALNDISPAEVNAEVLDVMNTDTITLPGQTAPPAAPTHRQAIAWLYKVLRNRKSQTSTLWSLFADDETTVDAKATVSDDGSTAIKQEIVSGP